MSLSVGVRLCTLQGRKIRLNEELRNARADMPQAIHADEPQETGIRLEQCAVFAQGCRSDREHRLQFGRIPRHRLSDANEMGGRADRSQRISAEDVRSYHVCQAVEAVDGKSAEDNCWSCTTETIGQLRDRRLGNG